MRNIAAVMGLLFVQGAAAGGSPDQCVRIADDAARLACFDALFKPTATAKSQAQPQSPSQPSQPSPPLPPPPQAAVEKFGDTGQLHPLAKADIPKRLTSHVQAAQALANGFYRLVLDNGQIWQTVEANWAVEFKAGDEVTVTRLALGGFQIAAAGSAIGVSGRRVR